MALDKNFVGELTARALRNHIEDMRNNNLVPVGNYVYEHNPEGYDYWEAEEKLDTDDMFRRRQKIVNDTADMFDELVKSVEIEETNEEYQKKVNVAFDALKEILYDLEW